MVFSTMNWHDYEVSAAHFPRVVSLKLQQFRAPQPISEPSPVYLSLLFYLYLIYLSLLRGIQM